MRRKFVVPEVTLCRGGAQTLPGQVEEQIAKAIADRRLPTGSRLPSSRVLARLLGVSRNTVMAAYEALEDRGLVQPQAGSGVRVQSAARPAGPSLGNVRRALREAHYPVELQPFVDPDGTGLYFNIGV